MKRDMTLVMPHEIACRLEEHLLPGDGLEAAALLLCKEIRGRRLKLICREFMAVPYAACKRDQDGITWPGEYLEAAIDASEEHEECVIAIHSHPGGYFAFSHLDDESDALVMPALWHGTGRNCGSAIMTPDGAIRARIYSGGIHPTPADLVLLAGPDIRPFWACETTFQRAASPPMAFSNGMTAWLGKLSACVVGVSGTGAIVAEQLARLGFGEIILIDFDRVEKRNLNRILNATLADCGRLKVDVIAESIRHHHPECRVICVPYSIVSREAITAAADADIMFSCVDSATGRHLADRLGAALCIPLFDVGVTIPTVEVGGTRRIAEVLGRVDYVFPSGSSLMDRGVYDAALLEAEYLAEVAAEVHANRIREGYIRGVAEEAPSVISLNMRASSACVLEAIARIFPFREMPNSDKARTIFMLAESTEETQSETSFKRSHSFPPATGLAEPLLGLPSLAVRKNAA